MDTASALPGLMPAKGWRVELMNFKAIVVLCVFVVALSCRLRSQEEEEIPPYPKGYDVYNAAEGAGEKEFARPDESTESMRVDSIISAKKLVFDKKLENDMAQQTRRMLRMDVATRNAAIQYGLSDRVRNDVNFSRAYGRELVSYCLEIRRGVLERDAGLNPAALRIWTIPMEIEFALFELTILSRRGVPLRNPLPALLKRWEAKDADMNQFVEECFEFYIKYNENRRVAEYIGFCLAFTPGSSRKLSAMAAVHSARWEKDLVGYFEACAAMNQFLLESKAKIDDAGEVFVQAMTADPKTRAVFFTLLSFQGTSPQIPERHMVVIKKTIGILGKFKQLSASQAELLEVLKAMESPFYGGIQTGEDVKSWFGF